MTSVSGKLTAHRPWLSLVIPTRNERGNVSELMSRLSNVAGEVPMELVVVDDSDDETAALLENEAGRFPGSAEIIRRAPGERSDGLGGAVCAGFKRSSAPYVCVMDADLQHPPEIIARMLEAARREDLDVVVASRYCSGGGDNFGLGRRLISKASTWAARLAFPWRLRNVSDPMSGFFVLRKAAIDSAALRPRGFKILLEILLRTRGLRTGEVPYEFGARHSGESKACLAEARRYLLQLVRLRLATPVVSFSLVGASGILVNQVLLWAAVDRVGIGYVIGAVVATQGSTFWNWLLTERFVFPERGRGTRLRRWLGFAAFNNAALLLRVPLLAWLTSSVGLHYLISNLITLLILFSSRFVLADRFIWKKAEAGVDTEPATAEPGRTAEPQGGVLIDLLGGASPQGPPAGASPPRALPHRYSVHGFVTIASEVPLRELEWFRSEPVGDDADIEIRVGTVGRRRPRARTLVSQAPGWAVYEEHLGALAANFSVDLDERIHVTVAPLLAHSPHVVYTNVIEGLLRFVLVDRGRVLLHSATIVLDGRGVMLSAHTDTGKTGTILRLLQEHEGGFLSDDMTILEPSALAWSYPKPLTISAHTLALVNRRALSAPERAKLAVQSRVHSKSGRSAGARLASMNLPIMALNSVTQMLIPPPKYMVTRLVPTAIQDSVRVDRLFLIQKGPKFRRAVSHEDALASLIENTDDAYSFPPFRDFAPAISISGDGYLTLRAKEEAIIAAVVRQLEVTRLSCDDFSWADTIPRLLPIRTDPSRTAAAEVTPTLSSTKRRPDRQEKQDRPYR